MAERARQRRLQKEVEKRQEQLQQQQEQLQLLKQHQQAQYEMKVEEKKHWTAQFDRLEQANISEQKHHLQQRHAQQQRHEEQLQVHQQTIMQLRQAVRQAEDEARVAKSRADDMLTARDKNPGPTGGSGSATTKAQAQQYTNMRK